MVRFRNSNNDDDDDDDLDETSFMDQANENEEQAEKVRLWDAFQDIPEEFQSGSMADTSIYDIAVQIIKILAYVVTFCVVLFGAAIAKTLLLLMTSQLSEDRVITIAYDGKKTSAMEIPYLEKVQYIWALLIAYAAPELIGTFVRSLRMVLFKGYSKETKSKEQRATEPWIPDHVLVVTIAESLQTIGMALLIFEVLPQLDVVRGIMLTNCVCIIPALLSALSYDPQDKNDRAKIIGDGIAVALQFTGLIAWPIIASEDGNHRGWFIPLSLLLISCGWWINFVSSSSRNPFIEYLGRIKDTLHDREILLYNTFLYVSVWKVILFFCTTLIILEAQGNSVQTFFDTTVEAFEGPHVYQSSRIVQVSSQPEVYALTKETLDITSSADAVWWILGAQVLAAYLCYVFGKFACKILIQPFSFAFPSILVVPVTVLFFVVVTTNRNNDAGFYEDLFPSYLFFNTPPVYDANTFFSQQHAWIWIFWIVSQIWITLHVWFPRCGRLARTEKLFSFPMYSEFLVEQSMCLNRRRDEIEIKEETDEVESDKIPHIIACATMWHEEKTEMLAMLKSVLRLDDDQCARRLMKETLNNSKADINYYTYETHIFFDDAFAIESEDNASMIVNKWVKDFVDSVEDAVHEIHNDKIDPPIRYPTPYGGRLEYTLPGKTMLYVHLKNKDKIRHRKRWSQVMYMYYLLGYRLMEQPLPQERKELRANNTFLLALDGDIDFNAKAVTLLVDLMKKNDNLGAACGRIHPVGGGPMAWYQIFEYAIGHWLQKATEHMIGCVLCSPGCFSLFRAKALMDDNVMKRYTFTPQEARHHVQYDQGEDRWLCTLLLQRGYRVEYSAASDAYTHCPESFNEFYNQRRRWVPSTMANILDLLESYKMTVRINNNISFSYIVYQMMLLGGTILGPGTIFLMLVGAFNAAFKVDNWTAFYLNLVPIVLYILFCLFLSSNFQLTAALIISSIYGLVMMAVLVGILIQIEEDGPLAPSTLFLFIVAGEIIVAGLFHPQEWYCLPSGAIYYVTIPSMYLLLIIYSVCNLNNISWGTRDVAVKKTKAQLEQEQKEMEEAKKKAKQNSFFGFLETYADRNKREEQGSIEFSLAGLFKCLCCVSPKPDDEKQQLIRIADTLGGVKRRLENIEKIVDPNGVGSRRRTTSNGSMMENRMTMNPNQVLDTMEEMEEPSDDEIEHEEQKEAERDDLINPYWIEDKDLRNGKVDHIGSKEVTFWQELIEKYLKPLTLDKSEKQKVEQSLKDLRDKMVLAFFMINALFVVVLFLLQLNKDTIFLNWPLGAKTNISYDELSLEIEVEKSYLKLEPFGLVFVIFFAIILVIQFTGMMFHRFETLCHLLSTSSLTIFGGNKELSQSQRIEAKLNEAKKQKDQKVFEEAGLDTTEVNKRQTVLFRKTMAPTNNRQSLDLDAQYKAIFNEIKNNEENALREKEERRRSSAGVGFMSKVRNSIAGGNRSSFAGGIRNSFAGPRNSFAERNKNLTAQNYPSPRVLRKTVTGKLEPKMADFQTIKEDDSEVLP